MKFLWLFFAVAASASWAAASSSSRATLREYDLLRSFPPGRLAALTAADQPDEKGLTGTNRAGGTWYQAGAQRGSCRAVIAAVVADDLAAADRAWRGIEVTFDHQQADGGFTAAVRPDGKSLGDYPAAVETAYFFLQELGRAILVIRQSPHAAHFEVRLAALQPKLRRAADFIAGGFDTIYPKVSHSVNRLVIAAKAFGTCGLVLGDEKPVRQARQLIAQAITLRDEGGVFIENGGRDSSYNVVSILFGQVLALHLPIPEFEAVLPAAVKWQLTRVLPDGTVDATGNTRTGVGKEPNPFGKPKDVNYAEVVQALTIYGLLHQDKQVLAAADRVFQRAYGRGKEEGK